MNVVLRNPRREIEVAGPMTVAALLTHLDIVPESVLVIQGDTLVTHDAAGATRAAHRIQDAAFGIA